MDSYDVGIIGAGVAGSSLAILLADAGKKVVVFEKESYPSHKVCGEFVSLESYEFFKALGLPLEKWGLPIIKNLKLSSQKGRVLETRLDMGGFGLSRYKLDYELSKQMIRSGVKFYSQEKVQIIKNKTIKTKEREVSCKLVIGSHGKYSAGYLAQPKPLNQHNYVGVKYHITGKFDQNTISLHSFKGGYCGMSKIEEELYCLCYLVDSSILRQNENSIKRLEERVLWQNKYLYDLFKQATFVWEKPLVISNIKFNKQTLSNDQMLFLGDAAGSISPLSGNGISIAARSAHILFKLILKEKDFNSLSVKYNKEWDFHFGARVKKAGLLNKIMLNPSLHHAILGLLKSIPPLRKKVVNDMQGKPIIRD